MINITMVAIRVPLHQRPGPPEFYLVVEAYDRRLIRETHEMVEPLLGVQVFSEFVHGAFRDTKLRFIPSCLKGIFKAAVFKRHP